MTKNRLFRSLFGLVLAAACTACVAAEATDTAKDGRASSCTAERYSVQQAVEAYYVLEGAFPETEADLVPNYLRAESTSMDLDSEGNVMAAPGSGCS